jgi:hypothetical protein
MEMNGAFFESDTRTYAIDQNVDQKMMGEKRRKDGIEVEEWKMEGRLPCNQSRSTEVSHMSTASLQQPRYRHQLYEKPPWVLLSAVGTAN